MADAILFVIGASGAGKTVAVEALAQRAPPGVSCFSFDDIGVPSAEVMERDFGGGEGWQEAMTAEWVRRMIEASCRVAILDGQTRPSFIASALRRTTASVTIRTILLDCTPEVRSARLAGRGQPELATEQMHRWAAYLRGQADALGVPVVDTSDLTVTEVADRIASHLP